MALFTHSQRRNAVLFIITSALLLLLIGAPSIDTYNSEAGTQDSPTDTRYTITLPWQLNAGYVTQLICKSTATESVIATFTSSNNETFATEFSIPKSKTLTVKNISGFTKNISKGKSGIVELELPNRDTTCSSKIYYKTTGTAVTFDNSNISEGGGIFVNDPVSLKKTVSEADLIVQNLSNANASLNLVLMADGDYVETKNFEIPALGEFVFPVDDQNLNTKLAYLLRLDNSDETDEQIRFAAYLREKRTDNTFRQVKAQAIKEIVVAPFDNNSSYYSYLSCDTTVKAVIPAIFSNGEKNYISTSTISKSVNKSLTSFTNLTKTLTTKTGNAAIFITNDAASCGIKIKNGNTVIKATNDDIIYPKGYIVHAPSTTTTSAKLYVYNVGTVNLVARLDKYSEDGTLDGYSAIEIPAYSKKVITLSGANKAKTYHISSSMPFVVALNHGTKTEKGVHPIAVSKAVPVTEEIAISNIAKGPSSFKYVISNNEGIPITSGTEWVPEFGRRKFNFGQIATPEDTVTILPTPNTIRATECNHMGECAPAPHWALVGSIISSGAPLANDNDLPVDAYNALWNFNEHTQDPLPCLDNNSKSCGVNEAVAKIADDITPIAMEGSDINKNKKLKDLNSDGTCDGAQNKDRRDCYACLYDDFGSHMAPEQYQGHLIRCTPDDCRPESTANKWADKCTLDKDGNCVNFWRAMCSKKKRAYDFEGYYPYSEIASRANIQDPKLDPFHYNNGKFDLDIFFGVYIDKNDYLKVIPDDYDFTSNQMPSTPNITFGYYNNSAFITGLNKILEENFKGCDSVEIHRSNHSNDFFCPITAKTYEVCNSTINPESISIVEEGCNTFGSLEEAKNRFENICKDNPACSGKEIILEGFSQNRYFVNDYDTLLLDDFRGIDSFGQYLLKPGWGNFIKPRLGLLGIRFGWIPENKCRANTVNTKYQLKLVDNKISIGLESCDEKIRPNKKINCEMGSDHDEYCLDQSGNKKKLCCYQDSLDEAPRGVYEYSDNDNGCSCNKAGSECSEDRKIEKCNTDDGTSTTVQICNGFKWEKLHNCSAYKSILVATKIPSVLCYDDKFEIHRKRCEMVKIPIPHYSCEDVGSFSIPESDGFTNFLDDYDTYLLDETKYKPLPVVNQYNERIMDSNGNEKMVCCPDYGEGYDGGQITYYNTCCDEGLHYSLRRDGKYLSSAVHGNCCPDGTEWHINNNGLNGACCKDEEIPCGYGRNGICCRKGQTCQNSWGLTEPKCIDMPGTTLITPSF